MSGPLAPIASRFVSDLLSYMTLAEKLGQLNLAHSPDDPGLEQAITEGLVGGVSGSDQAIRWQNLAIDRSRLGIPLLLISPDGARDYSPWALAASWDEDLLRDLGADAARHAIQSGGNAFSGPLLSTIAKVDEGQLDLATTEPLLAARLALAYCEGAMSDQGGDGAALPFARCSGDTETVRRIAIALANRAGAAAIDMSGLDHAVAARIGFQGIITTECARIRSVVAQQFVTTSASSLTEAAEQALAAGLLGPDEIDAAVRGVISAKFELGLFRDPNRSLSSGRPSDERALAADRRRRTMVLLRNEAGLLPLSPVSDRVLLVGSHTGAARGCAQALGQAGISYSAVSGLAARRGLESASQPIAGDPFAAALTREAAKRVDFALVVLEDEHFAPDSRTDWPVPGPAILGLLRALATAGTRLVALVATSGPVDLGDADQYLSAVLQCWTPGAGFEDALADILVGRAGPQGRMPVTAGGFIFGHGLSYSDGIYSGLTATQADGHLDCSIMVRNPASFAGREVVQAYVRDAAGATRLAAYRSVTLTAGEEKTVRFQLGARELAIVYPSGTLEVSPGPMEILVGKDSRRLLSAKLDISPAVAREISDRDRPKLRLAS